MHKQRLIKFRRFYFAMKGGGSCVGMKRDKDYGLVSGDDELRILRRLDKESVMRMHRCAEVRCTELIPLKYDYCQKHYEARMQRFNKERTKSQELSAKTLRGQQQLREATQNYDNTKRQELHDGFYQSKPWTKIAEYVKQRDGYLDGVDGRAWDKGQLIVDHLIPRRLLDQQAQYDTSNLWLLTRSQHNHKTAVEKKLNDNQLKKVSKDWWIKVLKK